MFAFRAAQISGMRSKILRKVHFNLDGSLLNKKSKGFNDHIGAQQL